MRSIFLNRAVLCGVLLSLPISSFAASTVYDNTAVPATDGSGNQLYYPSASEYGDEITLGGSTSDRVLSQFDFYYFYSGLSAGSATATIRFYKNDGLDGVPRTVFFTSDAITLNPGYVHQTITFDTASNLLAPNSFTWTVQFSNLGANQAGLLVYGPPTVGSSFDDFWQKATNGIWSTLQITGGGPSDFAARFGATVQVVPPSIVYDNTSIPATDGSGNQLYYPSASEYGDEITLDTNTTARVLSQFDFYYFYSGVSAGGASATIHFYNNDGLGGAPGTVFFTSDPITLNPGYVHQTITFNTASNLVVPDSFTWTVQFSNLGANQAGLLVYGPPTVGSSFNDFWLKTNSTWSTFQVSGGPSDFASRFGATVTVIPLSITSFALSPANGHVTFNIYGGTPPYQVQMRTNFITDAWVNFGTPFTNSPATFTSPGGSQAFFRVVGQ